ncbi:hypothetical protein XENOCAPTIV_009529 [Xenoophorus captivus]|uniref:Uncharacterized protein n=1 Tax=Xenoophorus captivus TaxID=1517983 RepID=A0ABV0R0E3_9TELE
MVETPFCDEERLQERCSAMLYLSMLTCHTIGILFPHISSKAPPDLRASKLGRRGCKWRQKPASRNHWAGLSSGDITPPSWNTAFYSWSPVADALRFWISSSESWIVALTT